MKRVRINKGYAGLVYRKGDYQKVLTAGTHWILPFDTVQSWDMAKPFVPATDLDLLLRDKALASMLYVVDVQDAELVLRYERGAFKGVLTPGRYAFWKGLRDYTFITADLSKVDITEDIRVDTIKRQELVPYVRVCRVESYERGVLFVDNKPDRVLGPGDYHFWKNAKVVTVSKADLRVQTMEITGQEILTRDKAAIRVNFSTLYKVTDLDKALIANKDYEKQLYVAVQLALREYLSGLTLDELLVRKGEVGEIILEDLRKNTKELGVKISHCGIKDIILPGDVKDILNQVLIAQKKAEANVIARREETASTRSLLNTAKLMEDNTMLFKLKEMEYVEKIAERINSISLSGGSQVVDQLRDIFAPRS